jgi:hypothetical protein
MTPLKESDGPAGRRAPSRYFRRRTGAGAVAVDARDSREAQAWLVERRRSSPTERAAWERQRLFAD